MGTLVKFSLVFALIGLNAFFVAMEFALVASDRARLAAKAAEGSWGARAALTLTKRLSFHLSGAQLGITIASLGLGSLAEPLLASVIAPRFESLVPEGILEAISAESLAIILALILASTFHMVAGELVPKGVAIAHPEKTAIVLSPAVRVVNTVLAPIILLFDGAANALVRRLGMEPTDELASVRNLEEVEHLIRSSGEHGSIDAAAVELLTKTIRFGGKIAADALTQRVHVKSLEKSATGADLLRLVAETGFTRFPVYEDQIDEIVGVVYLQALFDVAFAERDQVKISTLMVDPVIVPETKDLLDILADFRTSNFKMMIVADEHGGFEGVITLEDVLEEIVGEIDDEYDTAEVLTTTSVPGVFVVGGTLNTDEVSDEVGLEVPEGEYETIAGFVLAQLGHIPVEGESVSFDGWILEVVEMDRHRIASIQMSRTGEDEWA